jgi:ATP-binding protein involved in chromosome partitioning
MAESQRQSVYNLTSGGANIKTFLVNAVKGGVGKTKVTAGLGKALARQGKKVAFLDLDFFAPTLDIELDVTTPLEGDGNGHVLPGHTADGSQFVSLGQVYVADQAVTVMEDSAVYDIEQLLTPGMIQWEPADYMVIDTAPTSSGTIQASLKAPDLAGSIIVSQPSRVSRADLLRSLSLMKDKRVPILGVVVNQAYYICPDCGHQSAAYDLTAADIEELVSRWHVPVLGVIPHAGDLDKYFDALAVRVLSAEPVILSGEKKVSSLPRRLMTWIGRVVPGQTVPDK